jgi:hypothetical protein
MTRVLTTIAGNPAARAARRLPVRVKVRFAAADGTCRTLEGDVRYKAGDALIEGAQGDHWPVPREVFRERYAVEAGASHMTDGWYTKLPATVMALRLSEPVEIVLSEQRGVLSGRPGDWVIERAPGKLAVVAGALFEKTYRLAGPE